MQGFLIACFIVSIAFAALMVLAGGTDFHMGFAAVTLAVGALCLGVSALIGRLDGILRELKLQRVASRGDQ